MSTVLTLEAIEVHAEGEPGRVITSAAELVRGSTMVERFDYCRAELEPVRQLILHEPRGYPGLCAVFILPPVSPGSDFGMIVLEQGGFTPMSGSNSICAVTAVLESGWLPMVEPVTDVTIDTAVGTVQAQAVVSGAKVRSVTVRNVAAFVIALDLPLSVPEFGTVPVDIAFGGQFFVQARAADLGLTLDPDRGREIARAGALLKIAARDQVPVRHPVNPAIDAINLVMLHTGDRSPDHEDRNTVVLSNGVLRADDPRTWTGALDRSPCGTGTCARMAALHARGQLAIGERFSHRSILGSEFIGELTGTTTVGSFPAVLPTITGTAWVTGHSRWVLDDTDPYPAGYTVGDIWAPQP
jgi:proline racemase